MKSFRLLPLILLMAVLLVLSFAGCGQENPAHEHHYGDWYVITAPTHTSPGLEARNCVNCTEKDTRAIAATGHTFSSDWDYDADTHFHTCSCGAEDERASHDFDESGVCRVCRVDRTRLSYTKSGGVITMGTYPQSRVTDEELIGSLTAAAGALPSTLDAGDWTPYDDCAADSMADDFMWYRDISLGTETYRGVYFTAYRPLSPDLPSAGSYSEQDDNGYAKNTVYWFRYEPVRWRILTRIDGKVLLLADLIIDAFPYQDNVRMYPDEENPTSTVTDANGAPDGTSANNYAYSRVRSFLTDTFYRTAFTDEEAALLNTVSVTGDYSLPASTGDRVFLLSAWDILKYCGTAETQFRRGSDYAACRGLRMLREDNRFAGGGYWFLRTPKVGLPFASAKLHCELTASVCMVMATGNRNYDLSQDSTRVDYSFVGTVPAVWLTLAEAE